MTVHTGFGYEFNSLQSKEDEFSVAFSSLTFRGNVSTTPSRWTIWPILMAFAPIILKLVRILSFPAFWRTYRNNPVIQPLLLGGVKRLRAAKKIIDRIGNQLVTERKSTLLREQLHGVREKADTTGKDLLTLLVRANLQDTDSMSDSDVRAREGSFHAPSADLHNPYPFQRSVPSSSLATRRRAPPCLGPYSDCVKT
jgi:hypothetical protein